MKRRIRVWLLGIAFTMICGGCGDEMAQNKSEETQMTDNSETIIRIKESEESVDMLKNGEETKTSIIGSVPYFKDDTGKDAQLVDGYLYGYWNGRLCRYDVYNDYKEQILFDAGCNQAGNFCIADGVIYFLTRPVTSTITNENTCLYKINCDGSGLALLQDEIPDVTNSWGNYEIDIYEDIIYLREKTYYETHYLYYRLVTAESVKSVPTEVTLYGKIPEGFEEARSGELPSLVYMMRNYGYVFLEKKEEEGLFVYDLETGKLEEVCFGDVDVYPYTMFLTNDYLIFREYNTKAFTKQWYRVSLDDLQNPQEWILFDDSYGAVDAFFYDEQGTYFVQWDYDYDTWLIYYAGWEAATPVLVSKTCKTEGRYDVSAVRYGGGDLWYFDGEAFFYNEDGGNYNKEMRGQDCIIRNDLKGRGQIISVYNESPDAGERLCYFKKEELIYCLTDGVAAELEKDLPGFYGDGSLRFTMKKAYLRGDTEAVRKINECLQAKYDEIVEEWIDYAELWESLMTENMELVDLTESDWVDLTGTDMEAYAYIDYTDEQYIVFRISDGGYWSGAAHPNYYYTHYVFDRSTGERLSIGDIVAKSDEEICDIIAPYIDKDYNFNEGIWDIEPKMVLHPGRLFLTKEGVGIFFNRYEIDCYAAGEIEFVIPYEAFE